MEEDIFIVESFLKNKEMLLKHPTWVSQKTIQAIENLINKNKEQERDIRASHILLAKYSQKIEEQEKVIELMAEDIAKHDFGEDICRHAKEDNECYANMLNTCCECVIEYYEKKAKGE